MSQSVFLLGFWLIVFYLWHTLGVTIGLHRLLSHRAFRCPKIVEYFWVLGAYLAFHGSPLWWATIHRAHHRYVETPLDPHSPKAGIVKAYMFFMPWKYLEHIDPVAQSPDILKDPIYEFLEQGSHRSGGTWHRAYALNVIVCIAFRALLLYFFGWPLALVSLIAGIMALNVPLILNIVCHIPRIGYKNYEIDDDSVNVWWMGVLAMGDGWHNNHHACPGSSRMGVRKHEFDLSWHVLRFLQRIGLVNSLNETVVDLPK